jgi:uroporphyrinogen-III synthase
MAAASLAGWTIGVTADRRAGEQIELLERRGARVVHAPTIRTIALHENAELRAATETIVRDPPSLVVLTTGVGARAWFDAADALGLGDALLAVLERASIVARGPKAAGAALTAGLRVVWQAATARTDEVVAYVADRCAAGDRMAVQLDGRAEPVLATALRDRGADVVAVPVYRWTMPDDDAPARRLVAAACAHQVDAITFTSAPAFSNCMAVAQRSGCGDEFVAALGGPVRSVTVGPVCSDAQRHAGVEPAVEPGRARLGAMVLALAHHACLADATDAVTVGRRRVVLRAGAAVIDDRTVELPPRERTLLAALLAQREAVVTKAALRRGAWPLEQAVDDHAVEMAVGRLRKRLDGLLQVAVVPRRGYHLTDR